MHIYHVLFTNISVILYYIYFLYYVLIYIISVTIFIPIIYVIS